jgi:hypothetical protein
MLAESSLGAGDFAVHRTPAVAVYGLSAASTYHLRVVAENANGQRSGEAIFTTQGFGGGLQLPDGRAFELVSPPDKHAAVLSTLGEVGLIQAAVDGSAIAYLGNAPTEGDAEGDAGSVQVLSRRSPGGWSSKDLATPHEAATGVSPGSAPEYRFFAEDLSSAIVQPYGRFNPALSPEASEQTPYMRKLAGCGAECYRPLVTGREPFANVPPGTPFGEETQCEENNGIGGGRAGTVCGPRLVAGSADAQHFLVRSAVPLQPGLPPDELYEWSGGALSLVSVLPPNGKGEELPAPTGPPGHGEEPLLGTGFGFGRDNARRAFSKDGSRVFWESGDGLYLRDTVRHQTLQVDAAEPGCLAEGECQSGAGRFQIASADGSRVYFTDTQHLTKDAGAVRADLYECKIVETEGKLSCALRDLTPSEAGKGADVQGDVLGASEDGSIVYVVADGALGTGVERGTCVESQGNSAQPPGSSCNLFELKDGVARLVTRLSGQDAKDWTQVNEYQLTRVSPSGQWLAFLSSASLTGYDNRDAVSAKPDAEAFLYDSAGAGSLVCASCDPSGARPRGAEYSALKASKALPVVAVEWEATGWLSALLPHPAAISSNEPTYQPRYLNDQGRLFFNSLDALVPQDVNATGDVYQYEPVGQGGCVTPNAGPGSTGCVDLISSGISPDPSAFLDASESGNDVFFLTSSKLSPLDKDTREDVYDAHVCSAEVPCFGEPAAQAPPCITEASCKAAPTPQPRLFGPPASATFSGPGNLIPELAPPAKKLTRAQLLPKAIRSCHTHHPHSKRRRRACERQAHHRYGPAKAVHATTRRRSK